jgi:hypothetical protein
MVTTVGVPVIATRMTTAHCFVVVTLSSVVVMVATDGVPVIATRMTTAHRFIVVTASSVVVMVATVGVPVTVTQMTTVQCFIVARSSSIVTAIVTVVMSATLTQIMIEHRVVTAVATTIGSVAVRQMVTAHRFVVAIATAAVLATVTPTVTEHCVIVRIGIANSLINDPNRRVKPMNASPTSVDAVTLAKKGTMRLAILRFTDQRTTVVGQSSDKRAAESTVSVRPQSNGRAGTDTPGSRGVRFMKPDKFSGSTSVETFLVQFGICSDYNH